MTTIMTDGHFLIADHRTSGNLRIRKPEGTVFKNSFNDETNKISKCSILINRRKDPEKFVAYGCAGNVAEIDQFHKAVKDGIITNSDQLSTYLDLLWSTCDFATNPPFSILLVSDKSKVYSVRRNYRKGWKKAIVELYGFNLEPDESCSIGSGKKHWDALSLLGVKKKIPLLHRFLVATYFDLSSSTSYDAYSVAEDNLVIGCQPTDEDIKEIIETNCGSIAGYRGRKNSLNSVIYTVNHIPIHQ
jgi:hypothetical protein